MNKLAEIRKRPDKDQWAVFSEKGKKLSKWYDSLKKAKERLREIEYFKNQSDDQENNILDIVNLTDQSTNKDTLTMKPSDYQFKYSNINKEAFGLTIPGQNEGLQNPNINDEETYFQFFSGKDNDQQNSNGVSSMNETFLDLESLLEKLEKEEELEAEASIVRTLLKKEAAGSLNMSWLDYLRGIPVASEMIFDRGMSKTESYYNSFSTISQAVLALIEEKDSFNQDEERAFAAFVYLLHNGKTCSDRITYQGESQGSLMEVIYSVFSLSDYVSGAALLVGGGMLGFNAFKNMGFDLKTLFKGIGAAGLLGSGSVMIADNYYYRDLIPLICRDPRGFSFLNGSLVYGEPSEDTYEIPSYREESKTYYDEEEMIPDFDFMARQPQNYSNNNYKDNTDTYNSEYKSNREHRKNRRENARERRRNRRSGFFGSRRR